MQKEKCFYDYPYGRIRIAFGMRYFVQNGKKTIPVYIRYQKWGREVRLEGKYILYGEKSGKWRLPGVIPFLWYIKISEMYTAEEIEQVFRNAIATASITTFRASK